MARRRGVWSVDVVMAVSRLILIEGMIGAGKTTTASHVAKWLADQGEDARAYHECADDHPIRTEPSTSCAQLLLNA